MTAGPVATMGARGARGLLPSCPTLAAMSKQRRRGTLQSPCCADTLSEPKAMRSPRAAGRGQRLSHLMRPERRLALALLLSLLIHTLLLSLTFGGQDLGLPGWALPWRDRRIEAPELRLVLVLPRVMAAGAAATSVDEALPLSPIDASVAGGPAQTPSVRPAPPSRLTADAPVPAADRMAEAVPRENVSTRAADSKAPVHADEPGDVAPARMPAPDVIALALPQ